MPSRLTRLLLSALFVAGVAGCGGASVPPPDVDAGEVDAAPADAGPRDSGADAGRVDAAGCADVDGDGHADVACGGDDCDDGDPSRYPGATEVCDADDEDCDAATYGADADADGFQSALCCNGAGNCGTDCDDTLNTVNPGAAEQCNGGIDDDCDGLDDAAEGVCTACPPGFEGMGTSCADIDECATGGYCGTGATSCTNTMGSFVCTCGVGYFAATPVGSLCDNLDECLATPNPCGVGVCTDNAGSYACSCPAGYRLASSPSITCVDIDECYENTDQCTDVAPTPSCVNNAGGYACVCPSGYEGSGRVGVGCTNSNECVSHSDDCDVLAACADTVGSFTCTCNSGYAGSGHGAGSCADVDECALAAQCGRTLGGGVNACANATGGYACTCGAGFVLSGSGLSATCVNVDECATSPVQCGRALAGGSVNGCADTSGGYACTCGAGFVASSATGVGGNQANNTANASGAVYVFSRVGTTWTQEAYVKASNTDAQDHFGDSVSLSSDGTRLAVGAYGEASNATGINGSQIDNSSRWAGAVYVFLRTGTTWRQEAYIKASNTNASDDFGSSVSLSSDGARLAVGAYGEASNATGIDGNQADNSASGAGAVYVY